MSRQGRVVLLVTPVIGVAVAVVILHDGRADLTADVVSHAGAEERFPGGSPRSAPRSVSPR